MENETAENFSRTHQTNRRSSQMHMIYPSYSLLGLAHITCRSRIKSYLGAYLIQLLCGAKVQEKKNKMDNHSMSANFGEDLSDSLNQQQKSMFPLIHQWSSADETDADFTPQGSYSEFSPRHSSSSNVRHITLFSVVSVHCLLYSSFHHRL